MLYKDAAGSATHDMETIMSEDHGPLRYDEVSAYRRVRFRHCPFGEKP